MQHSLVFHTHYSVRLPERELHTAAVASPRIIYPRLQFRFAFFFSFCTDAARKALLGKPASSSFRVSCQR